jgi:hypothetical protein
MASAASLDTLARVVSANDVTSPISGTRAALVRVEIFERQSPMGQGAGDDTPIGHVTFGDLLALRLESQPDQPLVEVIARRAVFHPLLPRTDTTLLRNPIPELVPLLTHAKGGILHYREHLVMQGDRVRLRAMVERLSPLRMVVRDDLGPVHLEEVLTSPPSGGNGTDEA